MRRVILNSQDTFINLQVTEVPSHNRTARKNTARIIKVLATIFVKILLIIEIILNIFLLFMK